MPSPRTWVLARELLSTGVRALAGECLVACTELPLPHWRFHRTRDSTTPQCNGVVVGHCKRVDVQVTWSLSMMVHIHHTSNPPLLSLLHCVPLCNACRVQVDVFGVDMSLHTFTEVHPLWYLDAWRLAAGTQMTEIDGWFAAHTGRTPYWQEQGGRTELFRWDLNSKSSTWHCFCPSCLSVSNVVSSTPPGDTCLNTV